MFWLSLFFELVVSILLIIVVLMQSSKGGGLAGTFGGGTFGAVFGVRRTADFLMKFTTVLATIFLLLALVINLFFLPGKSQKAESIIQSGRTEQQVPPPVLPQQQPSQPAATPTK
ncbi:MAG: preprotein translocase subunit SecG [Bacteroidota bacterium]